MGWPRLPTTPRSLSLGSLQGEPRLQPIQFFDDFLHAADYEREPIVIEFVGRITGRVIYGYRNGAVSVTMMAG